MSSWNIQGAFAKPKGMTLYLYKPQFSTCPPYLVELAKNHFSDLKL